MNKRYQVFISSTYADLMEERRYVMQVLMKMDCIPAGMGLFLSVNQEQWNFIRNIIWFIDSIIYLAALDISIVSENHTNISICNDMQASYYILGILNSKLIDFYFYLSNNNTQVSSTELNRLPIIKQNKEQLDTIKAVVQKICCQKKASPEVDTSGLERKLDDMVYNLYGIDDNERKVIEQNRGNRENQDG
jgi:hypothetical protein